MSKGVRREQCSDLIQETFMKLWKNCAKVTIGKSKSFLFTVANNLFIDDYRKQQTQIKLKQIPRTNSTSIDGQYEVEMQEFKNKLEAAIDSMTEASREVFVMHRFNEMSYKEIANTLGISVKSVEKRMSRALKHLAQKTINLKR